MIPQIVQEGINAGTNAISGAWDGFLGNSDGTKKVTRFAGDALKKAGGAYREFSVIKNANPIGYVVDELLFPEPVGDMTITGVRDKMLEAGKIDEFNKLIQMHN